MPSSRDFTEPKPTEEALRKSEERYRWLVETTDTGYVIVDDHGVVLDANRAYVRLSGHDKLNEILGRSVVEWTAEEERDKNAIAVALCMQDGFVRNLEITYVDRIGHRTPVEINATVVETEGRKTILSLCRDISERKRSEETLKRALERLDLATTAARLGIWDWDIAKNELVWDDRMYQLYGIKREDFTGAYEAWLAGIHPDDREAADRASRQAVRGEKEYDSEFRVVWPDGTVRHLRAYAVLTRDPDGKPLRMTGTNLDITAQKQAEEALRRSEALFSSAFRMSPAATILSRLQDGLCIDANEAYCRLVGFSRDEIVGRTTNELNIWLSPEERNRAIAEMSQSGRDRNVEITIRRKDGSLRSTLASAEIPIVEGKPCVLSFFYDITERKQAEEALRESERRYRALIDSSPDAITQTDLAGRILMCNAQTASLHDYESAQDLIGSSAFDLFAPDELEHAKTDMQRTLKEGVVRNSEYRLRRKDGSQFQAELSATVIQDTEGKPAFFMALTRDISERKRMDTALRESEERFSRLAQASFEGVAIHDKGRILDANQAMADLFGYEPSELIGMYVLDLAGPGSRDLVRAMFLAGHDRPYEAIGLRKDGTSFVGELNGKPMSYHGRVVRVTAIRDISERKRDEAAIAAEKERLAVTLRSIGDGVITTDITGAIAIMNRVAEELTGWTQSEAEGKPLAAVFAILDEVTREPCQNPVEKVLASGRIVESTNHTLLASRDGTERHIANSGAPITDRDGKTIGVVLVFRDITEKRRIQDAIQRAARLDSLGVLAGGIAHDFNNLLTGLFGYVELARSVSKDARAIEYLEATLATMNRARALTLQLLTFAKGGAPAQRITSLVPFIQEAVQFALSGANVSCHFSLPDDVWPCNIDKNQISQVIDNIVINAQQAMPNGGFIEISASNVFTEERQHPSLARGHYVRVSIADRGIGIPKDVIPRIFDPFYTTKTKGHGLGLATCYSIVSCHGGCIDVESEPGKGSAFHVYLPASPEAVVAGPATIIMQKGSGRVIVVDDEEAIRTTVRRMVEALGYTVVCRKEGKEAIDLYVEEAKAGRRFAAMILDLTIRGGMGGKETVAEIRKLDKDLPVFVASGYANDPVMRNPRQYGFTGSIGKPFTIAELSDMLKGSGKD